MKTTGDPETLASLMKAVFVRGYDPYLKRDLALQRFTTYCETHDLGFLLAPNDALETPLSQVLKEGFDKFQFGHFIDNPSGYWMTRFFMMNVIVDQLYAALPGKAFFEEIAKHRTTNGFEILNFAIVKTSKERADAFIEFLTSLPQSEQLRFLRWQSHAGMNDGKTVLWLLSLGVLNETPWPLMATWELVGPQLTQEDMDVVANDSQHQGKSVISFLMKGALEDNQILYILLSFLMRDVEFLELNDDDNTMSVRQRMLLMPINQSPSEPPSDDDRQRIANNASGAPKPNPLKINKI